MSANALVDVRLTLDIPEKTIDGIVGRPDDGSDEWRQEAYDKLEAWMRDEWAQYLDHMTNADADVEVDLA